MMSLKAIRRGGEKAISKRRKERIKSEQENKYIAKIIL